MSPFPAAPSVRHYRIHFVDLRPNGSIGMDVMVLNPCPVPRIAQQFHDRVMRDARHIADGYGVDEPISFVLLNADNSVAGYGEFRENDGNVEMADVIYVLSEMGWRSAFLYRVPS